MFFMGLRPSVALTPLTRVTVTQCRPSEAFTVTIGSHHSAIITDGSAAQCLACLVLACVV